MSLPHIGMTSAIVIVQAFFKLPYCYDLMGAASMSYPGSPALTAFLPHPLLCSSSLECGVIS